MSYYIFGRVQNREVRFVGCSRSVEIPADAILLQIVDDHPKVHWVKWSVRFRRSLTNPTALDHPLAAYFTNPLRPLFVMGDEDFQRRCTRENAAFLRFHRRHLDVLDQLFEGAFAKKKCGHEVYSAGEIIGQLRWGDGKGKGRSIDDRFVPWYSRLAQMLERDLTGFFKLRASMADGLVWDGRTWQQFASENAKILKWSEPFDEVEDSDWEFTE